MNESERFWAKVDVSGGPASCWIWQGCKDPSGYGRFSVGGRGGLMVGAHRYALGLSNTDARHALHKCDKPACVNPAHLRAGSHVDNMRDMARRERGHTTKLTAADVRQIRQQAAQGASHSALAALAGVSKSNVQAIVARQTWRHVP